MSAPERDDIAAHGDYYLMPLAEQIPQGERRLSVGCEFERRLSAEVDQKRQEWTERVRVMRSSAPDGQPDQRLHERLDYPRTVERRKR